MNTHPPSDADLVAAFTAEADQAVSAADFVRKRDYALRRQPAAHKSRLTRLAPILAVALIVGVAALFAITRSSGGTTPPSGSSECTADFKVAIAGQLQSMPPDIGFGLTYTGSSRCVVLLAPPKITIINGAGKQLGTQTGGPLAGRTYTAFTVHRGDELSFGISSFLGCYETPASNYTVVIRIFAAHGASATVQTSLPIQGRSSASPPPERCATSPIGDVGPLGVTSTAAAPTGVISGTLAAVGGPAPGIFEPVRGWVRITNTKSHRSRVVSVKADGRYSVSLVPGTYLLVGRSPQYNGGRTYDCQAAPAVVTAGHTTTADVSCEMK